MYECSQLYCIQLNKLKQKSMSFLSKIGQDAQKDRKLVMLRKKYYHDILQFNQQQQQKKKEDAIQRTRESNKKILKINQEILSTFQQQKIKMLQRKIERQSQLRFQYERQVREKSQTKKYEKEIEKQLVKMQEKESDKVSERRLQDLLKIYERVKPHNTHRRIKTEALKDMDNPQTQRKQPITHFQLNQSPSGFLPLIYKPSTNLQFLIQSSMRRGRSGQSLALLSKRTLF